MNGYDLIVTTAVAFLAVMAVGGILATIGLARSAAREDVARRDTSSDPLFQTPQPRKALPMNVPVIDVDLHPDGDTVTLTTDDNRKVYAFPIGAHDDVMISAPLPVHMTAVDLQRLHDAITAVQAGTWQPTPKLRTP